MPSSGLGRGKAWEDVHAGTWGWSPEVAPSPSKLWLSLCTMGLREQFMVPGEYRWPAHCDSGHPSSGEPHPEPSAETLAPKLGS